MNPKTKKKMLRVLTLYLPMMAFLIFIGIPLMWALSLSFREGSSVIRGEFQIIPRPATVLNYIYVWTSNKLNKFFVNSMITSFGSVFIIGFLALFNGYALSRFNFKGKQVFMVVLLMTQMIPLIFNMSSIFLMMVKLKLTNSLFGICLLHIAAGLPYNSLMMKSFIGGIPKEIDEAAAIDGCNRAQIIFKVILPAVRPGFTTVIAYAFITCWNEYLLSYTLLTDAKKFPISVGLKYLVGEYSTDYSALAAGCIIALIPPILLFAYVQKNLVSGLNAGAVKG
ncbi:ABC transporter permease subunit [Clostridium sp. MCC353]|uniref:carbohydrate ABC transporter permease n=1 Tax=Clostridium sp. MCC353 TaxID=2592646 RepID=UPI001C01D65C|nr:carbohydrate ABC transporter permease [Clostridium sp. MCC353]MBT9779860.1 ABC transporter permease subunit [Clostridium sp. MCC353]